MAIILIVLHNNIEIPSVMMLDKIVYYLPFFIMGRYAIGIRGILQNKEKTEIMVLGLFIENALYIVLSIILKKHDVAFLNQIRAFFMIGTIYIFANLCVKMQNGKKAKIIRNIIYPVNECGKYTLQLYLFNGYLLVAIRTLLVGILKVYNPIIIVSIITIGNLTITLFLCKKILIKIPIARVICGLRKP